MSAVLDMYANKSSLTSPARRAFTLIELLVVIAIVAIMLALIGPAFTNIKTAGDVTSAAYTISGALEAARTYAKANNTYCWTGFFEEDVSKPSGVVGSGRLVISIVASSDGTNIYGSASGPIDPTKLVQIGKLIKIENVHVPLFKPGSASGETFDSRPAPDYNPFNGYNDARIGEINGTSPNTAPHTTPYSFQYPVGNPTPTAQYTFKYLIQFSPRGESRINGNSYDIRHILEIGVLPTHGTAVPVATAGAGTSAAEYSGNVAAVQITGFGSTVKVYRR